MQSQHSKSKVLLSVILAVIVVCSLSAAAAHSHPLNHHHEDLAHCNLCVLAAELVAICAALLITLACAVKRSYVRPAAEVYLSNWQLPAQRIRPPPIS
jgi:hypothetical protein